MYGKSVPLDILGAQRFPGSYFSQMTMTQDGGNFVSLTEQPFLHAGNISVLICVRG
jgi:hypothetical protein